MRFWPDFSKHLTFNALLECNQDGKYAYSLLGSSSYGFHLILSQWTYFELLTEYFIKTPEIPKNDASPTHKMSLLWLSCFNDGQIVLRKEWPKFVSKGLVSAKAMHDPISPDVSNGSTPFYCLCSSEEGRQLIAENWTYFINNGLIAESMNQEISTKGYEGTSAFYFLTQTTKGRQIIINNWSYFINNDLILAQSMHRIVNTNEHQGSSPFFWLTAFADGKTFITFINASKSHIRHHERHHSILLACGVQNRETAHY